MEVSSVAPKEIRERVLIQWLQGISRDDIARNVGIGAGTASGIFKMYRQNDSDFDLLREYVLKVKRQGLTIDQFGSAIRLAKRLEKLNLNPEQIESFLDNIDEHCFKKGTETEVFVKKVVDVSNLSSKTKVPVEQLPSDIEKKKRESLLLGMEITMKTLDLEILYDKYNITEMQLREFAMNRPVIEGLQTTERNLAVVTAQRNAAYMEICQLRDRLDFEEYAIALRKMNATNEGKSRS